MLISKGSVFDLAATYVMLFKDNSLTNQQKSQILNDFCLVLKSGWTFKEIVHEMHKCMRGKKITIDSIPFYFSKYCNRNKGINDSNVMDPTKFYYHKELKIMAKPQCVNVDYNAGTMISNQSQEFFLEMAASYTLNELTDYFLSKNMIDTQEYSRGRLVGLMKYYVERYGIDEVLFMIEAANQSRIDENQKLPNIREFENYYTMAKGFIENAVSNGQYSGVIKVVPRRRVLFS